MQRDLSGNRIADVGGTRTYTYNNANRLSAVLDGGLTTATYVHNALGQRTTKTVGATDVIYLYDLAGNLLAEHDATGAMIRDYVWMNDAPVAQIDQGEVFHYLHVDHLNTPRLATNDAQTVVWRWDSDAFGTTLADEDPDGDLSATTVNLRFPGQYFDQETGFHYNYFRTYDPSTGRYFESDPIGLRGGPNTYAYVDGKPIENVDPFGLQVAGGLVPRLSPIARGVRNALEQAGRTPSRSQLEKLMQQNGLPPRLRFEQMIETVDSCPVPPRLNPPGTNPWASGLRVAERLVKTLNELARDGTLEHTPIPLQLRPTNRLWPENATTTPAMTEKELEECYRIGWCA